MKTLLVLLALALGTTANAATYVDYVCGSNDTSQTYVVRAQTLKSSQAFAVRVCRAESDQGQNCLAPICKRVVSSTKNSARPQVLNMLGGAEYLRTHSRESNGDQAAQDAATQAAFDAIERAKEDAYRDAVERFSNDYHNRH